MRSTWLGNGLCALVLGGLCLPAAWADFELKDDAGRRILLKDDGTWRYADAPAVAAADAASAPAEPQAELMLGNRVDAPGGCRFEVTLVNTLTYEIGSFVPAFTAYRANEVPYSSLTADFGRLRPGDRRQRPLRFVGIACAEIAELLVSGGDRCDMDDLNKFSEANGQCLARVRVLPSELLRFEKGK